MSDTHQQEVEVVVESASEAARPNLATLPYEAPATTERKLIMPLPSPSTSEDNSEAAPENTGTFVGSVPNVDTIMVAPSSPREVPR